MIVTFNSHAQAAGFPGWTAKHGWPIGEGFTREEAINALFRKLPPEIRNSINQKLSEIEK